MNRNDRSLLVASLVGALLLGSLWSERFISVAARSAPSASTGVDIPMQGSVRDAVGRVYTATATVHVDIAEPPPVPPPGPSILRVESAGSIVTSATGGVPLELVGTGFPLSGIRRLSVAGQIAVVTQWTTTRVSFTLPNVAQPVTGPLEVWVQPVSTWVSLVRGPLFTITPRVVPPLPPNPPPNSGALPTVDKVLAADGTVRDTVTAGDPITLVGQRFGAARGQLFVSGFAVVPISWNDTRIVFSFGEVNRTHRIWAIIVRADGGSSTVGGGSESRPQLPFVVAGAE